MKPCILIVEASAELEEAISYYEEQQVGLGLAFHREFQKAIVAIKRNPLWGTRHQKTQFRFRLLRRFPYVIFYTEGPDVILVVAVAHVRRRPNYWRGRSLE